MFPASVFYSVAAAFFEVHHLDGADACRGGSGEEVGLCLVEGDSKGVVASTQFQTLLHIFLAQDIENGKVDGLFLRKIKRYVGGSVEGVGHILR